MILRNTLSMLETVHNASLASETQDLRLAAWRASPYNRKMAEKNSRSRMIGILGGMGPEATLDLYHHIVRLTPATRDQDHIRVLIYSNPKIPDRTQALTGKGESPLQHLIESAMLLERGGAGIIAMPCNSSHHYLPEIRAQVGIPILDMIAATCSRILMLRPAARAVGLLAAIGTVQCGVYHKALSAAGLSILTPGDADQLKIQDGIVRIKAGVHDRSIQESFQSIGSKLVESGAEAVILGCTEIPLAFDPNGVDYLSLNSTRILAETAVAWALEKKSGAQ